MAQRIVGSLWLNTVVGDVSLPFTAVGFLGPVGACGIDQFVGMQWHFVMFKVNDLVRRSVRLQRVCRVCETGLIGRRVPSR